MAEGRLFVGTSGWSHLHWREAFYPAGLRAADWFRFYADRFGACEINGSFYRLPSEGADRTQPTTPVTPSNYKETRLRKILSVRTCRA